METTFIINELRKVAPELSNDKRLDDYFLYLSVYINWKLRKSLPLQPGERLCVPFDTSTAKAAALCFDRVWAPFDSDIPDEIIYSGSTTAEILQGCSNAIGMFGIKTGILSEKKPHLTFEQLKDFSTTMFHCILAEHCGWIPNTSLCPGMENEIITAYLVKLNQNIIQRESGIFSTPIYQDIGSWENTYFGSAPQLEGTKSSTLIFTLKNLDLVNPKEVSWKQVVEFRNDKEAHKKYNRCIRWFNREMLAKSHDEIEDVIFERIEDYKWALKKHGMKTILGVIHDVLSGDYLVGVSAVSGMVGVITHSPVLSMLAAGALSVGRITVSLAEKRIDYIDNIRETQKKYRDIAFIYEIEKRFKN